MIDQKLLAILACPLTKAPVVLDQNRLVSTDPETRRAYRIEDDIPIMLVEEGTTLGAEEHARILKEHGAQPFVPTQGKKKS
ncbi:Trm112 family protein [Candidatus Sumerlaeota bacterium]|nr:Trm112 family protein [Candidatus Sumerlaeota bacterium]